MEFRGTFPCVVAYIVIAGPAVAAVLYAFLGWRLASLATVGVQVSLSSLLKLDELSILLRSAAVPCQ